MRITGGIQLVNGMIIIRILFMVPSTSDICWLNNGQR